MPKGPPVTDAVEALIARVYQDHPKWKAPEIQSEVSYLLRAKNPGLPSRWPGLSTVQKALATIRKKAKELPDDPQEKPWSMATLDVHPISPEVLREVLEVCKLHIESGKSFTIREAKWVARLSTLFTEPQEISSNALHYARLEKIYRLIDRPFDSTVYDRLLMGLKREDVCHVKGFIPWLTIMAAQRGEGELKGFIKYIKRGKSQ